MVFTFLNDQREWGGGKNSNISQCENDMKVQFQCSQLKFFFFN